MEVATGRVLTHLQGGQSRFFGEHVFSPDGSTFATTTFKTKPHKKWVGEGKVIVLDAATGETRRTFDYPETVHNPSLSSDGRTLAISYWLADTDNCLELLDLTTGKQKELLKAQGLFFHEVLPDGKRLATWDEDRVRFYHAESGEEFAVTEVSPAMFGPASWGLNKPVPIPGTHLVSVPSANDWKPGFFLQWYERLFGVKNLGKRRFEWGLAFLDTRTGNKVATIEVPSVGGAISPDGKTLALPIDDYEQPPTIELWDIPPRKPLRWVLGLLAIPGAVTVMTLWRWCKTRLRSIASVTQKPLS